jgi:hypothetical protein
MDGGAATTGPGVELSSVTDADEGKGMILPCVFELVGAQNIDQSSNCI